jgi:Fic family protein
MPRPPKVPPRLESSELLKKLARDPQFRDLVTNTSPTLSGDRYLHWDELRRRDPPAGVTLEDWWAAIRYQRVSRQVLLPALIEAYGDRFYYVDLPQIHESLHDFDRTNVASVLLPALGDEETADEYRVRQLIEEAISSSIIEGAKPTTREQARAMVREQREPASRDERMILNNWRAMRRILELHGEGRDLTLDDLLELHRILGEDALDIPGAAGKLRGESDAVDVADLEGNVWYVPPPAKGIKARVQALLRFANGAEKRPFIHPVLRAIICHFWLGYEHPFRDGNGRMARALYYWCMLRHGYEMAEFLSISGPIDRSPTAYYMAFAYTETDIGDLTYFILHQLQVMQQALEELIAHLETRAERLRSLQKTVADFDELNHRQRTLLQHTVRHPRASYTIKGHAASHRVHYQTARADLLDLVQRGFFEEKRVGKGKRFFASPELANRVRKN